MGGLGLRNAELHSSAAFLSSQASCHELCNKLDSNHTWNPNDESSDCYAALMDYNNKVQPDNKLQLSEDPCPRQQLLSKFIDDQLLDTIREESSTNTHFQAHLNLTTASGAGSWLHAVPAKALGTHVDPSLYKTMIQRWIRQPLFETEFHCPLCDEVVDRFGDHCLTCACGGDRTKRYNLLRNEVYFLCNSAGLNPELERQGLLQPLPPVSTVQDSGVDRDPNLLRRPADIYLPRWRRGLPAALDLAVTSGLRNDLVDRTAQDGTTAVKSYEAFKRSYLNTESSCKENGITFIPIICKADGGGWGQAAHAVWGELAKYKSSMTGESSSITATHLLQSLGLILHRENARAILRRSHDNIDSNFRELLAASAACNSSETMYEM